MNSLTSLHIQNYKIHKDTIIDNIGNFIALIGKNDVGKSSVLDALNIFFNQKELRKYDFNDENHNIIIEFNGIIKDYDKNSLVSSETFTTEIMPTYLYFGSTLNNIVNIFEDYTIDGLILVIENQVKRFIQYNRDNFFQVVDGIEKYIEDTEDKLIELMSKWKDLLNDFNNDSKQIPIVNRGSGVQRICQMYYYLIQSIMKSNAKQYIVAIDEPEISLHPNQQRKLADIIKDISHNYNNIQIIITTHSPFVVKSLGKENIDNIRILRKDGDIIKDGPLKEKLITYKEDSEEYTSLNEINYVAFDEASEEFHQELYGKIEIDFFGESNGSKIDQIINKLKKNNYKCTNREKTFKDIANDILEGYSSNISLSDNQYISPDKPPEPNRSLCYCVRNAIDHPGLGNEKWKQNNIIGLSTEILIEIANCISDIKTRFKDECDKKIEKIDTYKGKQKYCTDIIGEEEHSPVYWTYHSFVKGEKLFQKESNGNYTLKESHVDEVLNALNQLLES